MKPKLEYGSSGQAVLEAQAKLNAMMPNTAPMLALDGKYGPKTVQRVKQFQVSRGLIADGIVGAKTWAALDGNLPPKPAGKPVVPPDPQKAGKRVQLGTKAWCSCGSGTSSIKFIPTDRMIANVNDWYPYGNVGPFGKCHSLYNPAVQIWTQAHKGVFSPRPCSPALQGPWSPGLPIELVGTPPAAALGMNSILICAFGGVISIVEKGK